MESSCSSTPTPAPEKPLALPTIKSTGEVADLAKKNVRELEEVLRREKKLLGNKALINNLSDKGAKIKEKVAMIEEEILKRRETEKETKEFEDKRDEVGKLEWNLQAEEIKMENLKLDSASACPMASKEQEKRLDSDDDEPEEEKLSDEQKILKMIATSQISQHQPKTLIYASCDPRYLFTKLAVSDFPDVTKFMKLKKRHDNTPRPMYNRPYAERFSLKETGGSGSGSGDQSTKQEASLSPLSKSVKSSSSSPMLPPYQEPTRTTGEERIAGASPKKIASDKLFKRHWDDSLLPHPSAFKFIYALSLEESYDLTIQQSEKFKTEEKERHERLAAIGWSNNFNSYNPPTKSIFREPKEELGIDLDDDDDESEDLSEESEDDMTEEGSDNEQNAGVSTSVELSSMINTNLNLG